MTGSWPFGSSWWGPPTRAFELAPKPRLVTRRREARAIRRALRDSEAFVNARDAGLLPEIAATHLLDAEPALEELLGVVETEDVLDVVFSSFCIGK